MRNGEVQRPSTAAAPARRCVVTAGAALGWALFTMTVLHVISSYNPVSDPVSLYSYTDEGTGMLEASLLSVAVGSLALLGALVFAGISIGRTVWLLTGTWSLGLIIAALFPATLGMSADITSGRIHQWACVVAFLSLPGAGYALIERLPQSPPFESGKALLTKFVRYSIASLAIFGLSYLVDKFSNISVFELLASVMPVGLTQRITLVIYLGMLTSMLLVAVRAIGPARQPGRSLVDI